MVLSLNLKLQQMDIKGAYLNCVLKEIIYMKQPEGFSNETKWVCRLNKTLYGLKQSELEWNNQLDHSLQSIGFRHLLIDSCTYLRTSNCDFQIITVWVDDPQIFATSDNGMKQTKDQIGTRWQVTDLSKPLKIIGIQIIRNTDSIMITQCQYIKNLLERHQMTHTNPIATPMDPNNTPKPSEDIAAID